MSNEKKVPTKDYREHGKSYTPYIDDIIISHLQGMSDKELANILERKVPLLKNKRTEVMRDFTLNNMSALNYFTWMATKFYLENKLLIEKLNIMGYTATIEIPNEEIKKEMQKNFDLAKEGKPLDDPRWKV